MDVLSIKLPFFCLNSVLVFVLKWKIMAVVLEGVCAHIHMRTYVVYCMSVRNYYVSFNSTRLFLVRYTTG